MFGLIHHQTVTIEPFSAEAATGFGGSATYRTAVSYACRVEMRQAKVVTREGKEAIAIGRVLIHGDVGGEFDVRARLTLPSGGAEAVVWTSLVGVTASGNSLTKTASGTDWGNAGAISSQQIASGDGYVEVTASEANTHRMFGLSNGNTDAGYQDIDFAFYQDSGAIRIYEAGVLKGYFGTYASGDKLRVSVTGGVVTYSKNGTTFYTSTKTPTFPLLVDAALKDQGATLNSAVISGVGVTTPPILAIERNPDPFGVCANTVVWFGRTGE